MNATIDITGVYLETESLILRPFQETDLQDLNEYARVPGVGELAGWVHHKSVEESKEILDMFINEKKTLAVAEKKSGKVIGSVGIECYNENCVGEEYKSLKCREIGYVLSKDYWGKGFMPQALSKVLSFCFEDLQLDAVFCGYFKRNQQSKRVNQKLGFKYVCDQMMATMYNTQEDSVLTVIHKKDWTET
ncbi:MAG TPA: GNAT family N-acetyltransferase [Clostridiaceae bacterium]|nr:GNAT family N-acetyltransferase [Clostridiaceae bacterium]